MSNSFAVTAPPTEQRRFAMKAGVVVASTAVAGAALLAGVPVAPLQAGLFSQHRGVALTGTAATGDALNIAGLLGLIDVDVNGTPTPISGLTLGQLVAAFPDANPTLDSALSSLGLTDGLDETIPQMLNSAAFGDVGTTVTINSLLGDLVPGVTASTTIGGLLSDLSFNGEPLADITVNSLLADFTPAGDPAIGNATTLTQLLADFPSIANMELPPLKILGGLITVPTGHLSSIVSDLGLGDDTLGDLLKFSATTNLGDLATEFKISDITINSLLGDLGAHDGITLSGASNLSEMVDFLGFGSTTLQDLIPGAADFNSSSTVSSLLSDSTLFGAIATDHIPALLAAMGL